MYEVRPFMYKDISKGFFDLINNPPKNYKKVLASMSEEIASDRKKVFVAEQSGLIVGTITLSITFGFSEQGRKKAYLNDLKVRGPYHEVGIGTSLVREAIFYCIERKIGHITLASSDINKKWYEKLGFKNTFYHMDLSLLCANCHRKLHKGIIELDGNSISQNGV